MKISTQPVSAFAVYSEKLKQKKKKSKSVTNGINKIKKAKVSNGVNKLEKTQVSNAINELEKTQFSNGVNKFKNAQVSNTVNKTKPKKGTTSEETWQKKEIGYILKTLAERSVDTSSPRATALLDSIMKANLSLQDEDSAFLEDTLKNVIVVEGLKKKASSMKRKKGNQKNKFTTSNDVSKTNHSNANTSPTIKILPSSETNCSPSELTTKDCQSSDVGKFVISEPKTSKVKKKKLSNKPDSSIDSDSKTELLQRQQKQTKAPQELKQTTFSNQFEKKSGKKEDMKHLNKCENSAATAKKLFEWIIIPVLEKDFMNQFWEKKPLLIQREGNRNYFSELLSTDIIDTMLRENNVCFTKHLDITSYADGVRETHNLTGRAQANVVWDFYSNGCSVRLLNPQIFLPKIHALNATLQEYFGCFVGANVYLTPPNSQGFAPHYDDIEAFVLQIEGKKRWKVYPPRFEAEVLPRFSSPNFSQEEIEEPFLDVTLEPGDLLYFPRGFIHQATTVEGEHSLHITLSAYQKTAWVDLLEKVLPIALKRAAESDVEFRKGLPRDYLGLEYQGSLREKQSFVDTAQALMTKLGNYVQHSLGAGVDQMGATFMHDALPPTLTPYEMQNSSMGGGLKLKNGKLEGRVEFQMETRVKLIRHNICRIVQDENEVRLYHCLDNSLEYHGDDPQFLVLPPEGVAIVTQLQTCHPAFVSLWDIPHVDPEALITLISDLWDAGLLIAEDLPVIDED